MRKLLIILFLFPTEVWAQQKPPPEIEALGSKLMQEINANIQCNANGIVGRQEIEKLQAEIKSLKEKLNAK